MASRTTPAPGKRSIAPIYIGKGRGNVIYFQPSVENIKRFDTFETKVKSLKKLILFLSFGAGEGREGGK